MSATADRLLGTAFVLAIGLLPAYGQHEAQIGAVRFPVSCRPAAQKTFERGVALLHSFWYDEAEKAFSEATRIDRGCAMGYWGIAMSHYHPVWLPPSAADLREGRAAVERAKAAAAKTRRERDYIAAIEAFYKDSDKIPHRERALAWSSSMQHLSARYPEDHEAAIFYTLSLLGTAPAFDKTYASQKHAAAILNRLLIEEPDHPGIAHYLIHSYDSAALARLGLPAGARLREDRSGGAAALHMPSHIFPPGSDSGRNRSTRISPRRPRRGATQPNRRREPSRRWTARHGLPGLRVSPDLPGSESRGGCGAGGGGNQSRFRSISGGLCVCRDSRAIRAGAPQLAGRRGSGCAPGGIPVGPASDTPKPPHISLEPWGRRASGTPLWRRPKSQN